MAHQTSTIQREQTTPRPIGRLMDADASWSILPRPIEIRWTFAFAVKGRQQIGSRCNYKAAVALQCPVRNGGERQGAGFGCTVLVPRVMNQRGLNSR